MSLYYKIRNWIDSRWAEQGMQIKGTLFISSLPFLILIVFDQFGTGALLTALFISVAWTSFVFWRGWRMGKAASINADRHFDRSGKFELSSDYHDSESATAASLRKKNG